MNMVPRNDPQTIERQVVTVWREPFKFGSPRVEYWPEGMTIGEMVARMDYLPERFSEFGVVKVNDDKIDRAAWHLLKPKASTATRDIAVTFHLPMQGGRGGGGKQVLALVAAVALAILTVGISNSLVLAGASASLGTLLGTTAAVGAKILAGAVGLIGALAISALTRPPSIKDGKSDDDTDKEAASAEGNVIEPNGAVPRVVGTRKIFPPLICEPLTELVGQDEYVEAVYAANGPHAISDIRIGNTPIAEADDITFETREGWDGDYPITTVVRQGRTTTPQIELSRHKVNRDANASLEISDDLNDALPVWHSFASRRSPDEVWIHIVNPEGLWTQENKTWQVAIPYRIRFRKKGETTWNNCPEVHFSSNRVGQIRCGVIFKWALQTEPRQGVVSSNGWYYAHKNVPDQTAAPVEGAWVAHSHFSAGSGGDALYNGVEGSSNIQNVEVGRRSQVRDKSGMGDTGDRSNIVTFYLDPAEFEPGFYEFEIKRGIAYYPRDFTKADYEYNSAIKNFFGYSGPTNAPVVPESPEGIAERAYLLRVSSVWNEHPSPLPGFALIAVKAKNRRIEKLSAIMSGYVKDYDGEGWNTWTTTSNPAPHFRDVLIGKLNLDPLPAALLDDDTMLEWRQRCADNDWTCDAIFDGARIDDVLDIIAGCGYARSYRCDVWGVVQDYDRSAESPVQVFSPRTSRGFSFRKAFARLPDGLRVSYRTDEGDYDTEQISVFYPGKVAADNSRMEQVTYEGLITEQKNIDRAQFDLNQGVYRSTFYSLEAPVESIVCRRGSLVGVTHDIIERQTGYARVRRVIKSSGYVTAIEIDAPITMARQGNFEDIVAFEDVAEVLDIGTVTSMAIRSTDGVISVYSVANAEGQFSVIEFTDPVEVTTWDGGPFDNGSVEHIAKGCHVTFGPAGQVYRRLIVSEILPGRDLTARLTFVDEAPELWAA